MKKKMMVVLDAYELECEIARRLGFTYHYAVRIRQALFYDNYQNDCYKYCSIEWIGENFYNEEDEKRETSLKSFEDS